ncbi:MAG: Thiol:disulfide interchange protein DsbD precursor [Planctomycetota bacterium]
MRTLGRLAVFPLSLLIAATLAIAAAPAQNPPRVPGIPGIPGIGRPAITAPAMQFGDSRDQVETGVVVAQQKALAGADLPIAITFRLAPGYHIWTKPGPVGDGFADFVGAIRTEVTINPNDSGKSSPVAGLESNIGFMQWPEAHGVKADLGDGMLTYAVYEGEFAVFIPASIAADAKPGTIEIPIRLDFQACNDIGCSAPATVDLTATVEIVANAADAGGSTAGDTFGSFDPTVYSRIRAGEKPSEVLEFNLFTLQFSIDPSGAGFLLLLVIAAAGGMLLNFTPCVLPVIPLKIMGLSQAAQGSRSKCFALGFVMSLGVVAFWMALGLAIATIKGFETTSQLFQKPEFTIAVGAVIGIMAIGMAGFFSLKLPDWVYMVEAKHDSYAGSFLFGIMTAVLSTPCTAPLMGTAVAWATTQGPGTILTVFAAVGTGMALPYLVLSAKPEWIDRMPRTGPASDLIKQVMGLLLLAAAAYFIGAGLAGLMVTPPEPPSHTYWWVVSAFGTAAGGWLAWRTFRLTRRAGNRVFFGGIGAFILVVSALIGLSQTAKGPIDWTYYTPERLAEAQGSGKVVVIDFTAEWCANCKTFEALVLNTPSVSKELNADDVAAIKVDLTGNNEAGNALLKASNRVTIPLLLIYGRDGSIVLNTENYTIQQVLDAITEARARGGA